MWRLIFAIFPIHDFGARFSIPRPVFFRLLPDVIKEQFSEGSEAVVLLSVVLSGLPVGIVLLE